MPATAPPNDVVGKWMGVGPGPRRRDINSERGELIKMVEENAVIVFAKRGSCMRHVVMRLLQVVGANPAMHEVEEEEEEDDMVGQLAAADGGGKIGFLQFPAVFIGGRWFGGLERIINATHIKEELTPLLKQAGALWL